MFCNYLYNDDLSHTFIDINCTYFVYELYTITLIVVIDYLILNSFRHATITKNGVTKTNNIYVCESVSDWTNMIQNKIN